MPGSSQGLDSEAAAGARLLVHQVDESEHGPGASSELVTSIRGSELVTGTVTVMVTQSQLETTWSHQQIGAPWGGFKLARSRLRPGARYFPEERSLAVTKEQYYLN